MSHNIIAAWKFSEVGL